VSVLRFDYTCYRYMRSCGACRNNNFFKAEQLGAENIDDYVHRLRGLAEPCQFGDLEDELVRDMLVIGTKDKASRGKIFRQDECDLKGAIKTLQINEQTNSRLKNMAKGDESVNYAQSQGQSHNPRRQKSSNTSSKNRHNTTTRMPKTCQNSNKAMLSVCNQENTSKPGIKLSCREKLPRDPTKSSPKQVSLFAATASI